MLKNKIRLLNFDGSLLSQRRLIDKYLPEIIDYRNLGLISRIWLGDSEAKKIGKDFNQQDKGAITFIGSGDYHHISGLLIDQFTQPISIIVFDNHPDWDIMPPRLGCGSWVSYVLQRPNIKNVLILAVTSQDISTGNIRTGNLASLKDNRVQLYPYNHEPTKITYRDVPINRCLHIERDKKDKTIHWQELKTKNLETFIPEVLNTLSTNEVYVSIDKDCLNSKYALTNWEEGQLDLQDLLLILNLIKQNKTIVGLDITGEYSQPKVKGLIRNLVSYFDHPKNNSARNKDFDYINQVNQETNLAILNLLAA